MRTIQLHPASLLVGFGVAVLAFFSMAQSVPQAPPPSISPRSPPQPIIDARDFVQIYQGQPYTVPPNKILVVTAAGTEHSMLGATVLVNNVTRVFANVTGTSYGASVVEMPRGLTVQAGDVVTVVSNSGQYPVGVAWGYLADA